MNEIESLRIAYEKLEQNLHGFNPEDCDWFMEGLHKLSQAYASPIICDFAFQEPDPLYCLELFAKSGFRDLPIDYLLDALKSKDEDQVYSAALSLAILNRKEGIVVLQLFADSNHPLQKHIHPKADLLEDLKFLDPSIQARVLNAKTENK